MTVKELIEKLKVFPEDTLIALYDGEWDTYQLAPNYYCPREVTVYDTVMEEGHWVSYYIKAVGLQADFVRPHNWM